MFLLKTSVCCLKTKLQDVRQHLIKMEEAEENLNIDALEALNITECPVCLETFCPPVFQCANGHLICSSCLDKVKNCPNCRQPMPVVRIRSLLAENLVSLKCPNFKWGCKATFKRNDKAEHELHCKYSARDYCSHIGLNELGIECNKIISKLDLPLHMKNEHKLTVIENNEAVISQELDVGKLNWQRKWRPVLFSAFHDFFFLDCEITDQSGSAAISWKCISAGSVSLAQQFVVTMKLFISTDKGISLNWEGNVTSVDQLQKKDLNFFSLAMNTLKELPSNKELEKLSWKMNIVIQKIDSITSTKNQVSQVINMTSMGLVPSIYQIIEGTYQYVSGSRLWGSRDGIVYSRNGSMWTRNVGDRLKYSFIFGKEFTFQFGGFDYMSTIIIENNKLIHREKEYLNGQFQGDITEVEEFSDNKILITVTWNGTSRTSVYKKING